MTKEECEELDIDYYDDYLPLAPYHSDNDIIEMIVYGTLHGD